jgi:hypothetical protein
MIKQWLGDDGLWDTELYQRYKKENFEILSKNISSYPNVKPLLKGLWNKDVHLTI